MDRRTYLATLATGTTAATAGCLSGLFASSSSKTVVLGEPADKLTDSEDLSYPAYGQEFPVFKLPDATSDAVVDTGALDTVAVVTTFFASCPSECGILLNNLAGVQDQVIQRGLVDDVTFLPITFDPARDDSAALRAHADKVGADLSAGNWYFLRPADADEVESVVTDQLGVGLDRVEESERLQGYDFSHIVITWLVNPEGVVERAYRGEFLDTGRVLDDIQTVVEESQTGE